jgi:thiol-disulfide isomerase/thioredoxin
MGKIKNDRNNLYFKQMRAKLNFVFTLIVIILMSCKNNDNTILSKTNFHLQKLSRIEYQADFKNFNPLTGELGKYDTATVLFDFTSDDTIIGSKYLIMQESRDMGFDGLTSFYTVKNKKHLIYNNVETKDYLIGTQFTMFSILQLRDLMPQMLSDSSIHFNRMSDTIINKTDCYKYEIVMHEKGINCNGEIVARENSNRSYELMIDKKDYFPRRFISFSYDHTPVWIVSHNKIDLFPSINNSLFNYSLRDSDFIKYTLEEYMAVLKNENILNGNSYLGKKAIDWTLPSINSESITLSQIDAELIMLEFWFPYCTGCIAAISEINKIQKKYESKGLKIYGIEFTKHDSTGLVDYTKKMKIEYPTLYSGKEVAEKYNVSAAPTIFLVNKKGEFIYARKGFIKDELVNEIEKIIK